MKRAMAAIAIAMAASTGCSRESSAHAQPRIQLGDCEIRGLAAVPARCGSYFVWENRTAKSGRQIAINFAVVPARGSQREQDPLFYFQGGPGGSAIDAAPNIVRLLEPVHASRDLVFIDVRGTGRSGALRCAPPSDDEPLQRYFDEFLSDDYVRKCLAAQTADVRYYTQPFAMDDVNEIREALGYERINLFGTSGGTRQAQIYTRRHPSTVRSMVIFGVQPMDAEMPLAFSKALDHGVAALIKACGEDAACRARYPDLAADWEKTKRQFDRGPVVAEAQHPRTWKPEKVTISKGVFADGIRHLLYDLNTARDLVTIITEAAAGKFDTFARREMTQVANYARTLSHGMYMSATCAEDVRFIDESDIQRATAGTFLGDYRVRRQQAACRIWPRGEGIDEGFQQPLRSEVPALVLSGDVDVATPPSEGERVARALPRALHVVFLNHAHNFANRPCAGRLIHEFIAKGSAEGLDGSCASETRRRPLLD